MRWLCKTCWRSGEIPDNESYEEMHTDAVGAHLKAMNSEAMRTPNVEQYPPGHRLMEKIVPVMHPPDLSFSEKLDKFRVKRTLPPELNFGGTNESSFENRD